MMTEAAIRQTAISLMGTPAPHNDRSVRQDGTAYGSGVEGIWAEVHTAAAGKQLRSVHPVDIESRQCIRNRRQYVAGLGKISRKGAIHSSLFGAGDLEQPLSGAKPQNAACAARERATRLWKQQPGATQQSRSQMLLIR